MALLVLTSAHAQTIAYITNLGSADVSVIDTGTNQVVTTIPLGPSPLGLVLKPDGTRLYVAAILTGQPTPATIYVIDTSNNTVIGNISIQPDVAEFLAISPDGKTLYASCPTGNDVLVIDTDNNVVQTIIPNAANRGLVVTPDGEFIYGALSAGGTLPGSVSVISSPTNTVDPINTVVGTIPVDVQPALPGITPNGDSVYVPNLVSNTISVISTASKSVTSISGTGLQGPFQVAIDPTGLSAYVSNHLGNSVSVIDTASKSLTGSIVPSVSSGPVGLAITPTGDFVYVVNNGSNTVSVRPTGLGSATDIPVGQSPGFIVIGNLNAPFANFTIQNLDINANKVRLEGEFTLGANSGGIDFTHQALMLRIGGFELTIPAGKIKQVSGPFHFIFHGFIGRMKVDFDQKSAHDSSTAFNFSLQVQGVQINAANPATVTLEIGHNTGTTTAEIN